MNANELADNQLTHVIGENNNGEEVVITLRKPLYLESFVRQQQAEIDRLNYDLDGFKQNFFVSGFHLQIKMANEQLVKQQEQIEELKSELDRAVELYTDKAIENEALKELLANEGIVVGHDYLNNCIATMRKAQEK